MTELLIISMLGIILLGYVIMSRIDHFIEKGGIVDSPQGRENQGVLVYGAPEAVSRIQKAGMNCRTLTDPIFPKDGLYSVFFILSGDDQINLVLCRAAKDFDPGIFVIARCNDPELSEIFEVAGANRLLRLDESVDSLLAELRGICK
ncbi:hypothetical protein EQM14_06480 [Caproiciproducens sp. NJN-50]|uniref:NAD-binding protein n=1 Tax=Acutalibacteraceae TaxID=3082771 RepID=UPI000FFE04EE|nr:MULTISPECIES: NAD-binding protein [Acutalibacteraceae]QAT49449.1 hypothetical protein EQM14_06480 [Caproiciproducens sp. NJN-50]